jgi:hypothetical protein
LHLSRLQASNDEQSNWSFHWWEGSNAVNGHSCSFSFFLEQHLSAILPMGATWSMSFARRTWSQVTVAVLLQKLEELTLMHLLMLTTRTLKMVCWLHQKSPTQRDLLPLRMPPPSSKMSLLFKQLTHASQLTTQRTDIDVPANAADDKDVRGISNGGIRTSTKRTFHGSIHMVVQHWQQHKMLRQTHFVMAMKCTGLCTTKRLLAQLCVIFSNQSCSTTWLLGCHDPWSPPETGKCDVGTEKWALNETVSAITVWHHVQAIEDVIEEVHADETLISAIWADLCPTSSFEKVDWRCGSWVLQQSVLKVVFCSPHETPHAMFSFRFLFSQNLSWRFWALFDHTRSIRWRAPQ